MIKEINFLPAPTDVDVKAAIKALGIRNDPIYVEVVPDNEAVYGNCFVNVFEKVKREKGKIIYGWHFCKHEYMVEAEFHGIWKSPVGQLLDVTPPFHPTLTQSLFVVDDVRTFEGRQIDNFRLNITENVLVDDIIEVERARFRFMNKGARASTIGLLDLNEQDSRLWELINFYAASLEQLYFKGWTIASICFCGSGAIYDKCHRQIFKQVMLQI